jgi:hypothetical protein
MVWAIIIVVYIIGLIIAGIYAFLDWDKKYRKKMKLFSEELYKRIKEKFDKYPEGSKYEVIKSTEIDDLNENLRLLPGAVVTVQKHGYDFTVVSFNISDNCARDVKIDTKDLDENCKKIEQTA